MPYAIRKRGKQHEVYNQSTGATVPGGAHPSYGAAQAHMRALYANVDDADKSMALEELEIKDFVSDDQRKWFFANFPEYSEKQGSHMSTWNKDHVAALAKHGSVTDIGQLSHEQRGHLNSLVAKGELEKAQDYNYPNPKTHYTSPGHYGTNILPVHKSIDLSYAKSMGLESFPDLCVKSVGQDEIQGYLTLWGNPGKVDLEKEYFTPETDFWDSVLKGNRPLTWDHAQDETTKSDPIIGDIVSMGDDKVGRWYVAKLKRAHQYRAAIDQLISDKSVGTSSDSAPQYVVREKTGKSTWLKRWPLFAAALTEVPCEPRQVATVDYFKSIGVLLPDLEAPEEQARAELESLKRRFSILKLST